MADPKDNKQNAEPVSELPVDREQGLALQFDDPGIAELLPLMAGEEPAAPSLTAEVAEAVQELVLDLNEAPAEAAPEAALAAVENNPALDFDLGAELADAALPEGEAPIGGDVANFGLGEPTTFLAIEASETAHNTARIQVAERMFELIITEKSFNDLSENLLAALVTAASGTAGSILELDQASNEFFFRAVYGSNDPEKVKAFRVPVGKGIVGHVAESRQPLLLNDVEGDARQLKAISMSAGLEIVSFMALPVLITNRLYGVVEVFNKAGDGRFDKSDLQLMEEGVRMAAKVLEVRFLMAELARKLGRG